MMFWAVFRRKTAQNPTPQKRKANYRRNNQIVIDRFFDKFCSGFGSAKTGHPPHPWICFVHRENFTLYYFYL